MEKHYEKFSQSQTEGETSGAEVRSLFLIAVFFNHFQ